MKAKIVSLLAGCLAIFSQTSWATDHRHDWSYGGGAFRDQFNGHWIESNNTGSFYYVETARRREYVEITDYNRHIAVRIYPQIERHRSILGPDAWHDGYQGGWVDEERHEWSYGGGAFQDQMNRNWIESNSTGSYYYVENYRDGDFVEIIDYSRRIAVRLYDGSEVHRSLDGNDTWHQGYSGEWVH